MKMRIEKQWGIAERKKRFLEAGMLLEAALILVLGIFYLSDYKLKKTSIETTGNGETIKWVDFNVSYEALNRAYQYDVDTYGEKIHLNWIELLAYTAAINGGTFGSDAVPDMKALAEKILTGETTMKKAVSDLKYYSYYLNAYTAVLAGYVGEYEIQETEDGEYVKKYGLKAYLPIAKDFPYSDYDDFGVSRNYGYKRQHLGHDMMGQIGTPIVAVESGTIEAIGWNQYGGWRIGIRSFDKKRYCYYAHLRQNYPYQEKLEVGSVVTAGDVIGYMGHTGYSKKENVNNIDSVHLHFGIELIFDEERRESGNEIWIDCYDLTRFLYQNRSEVYKVEGTKEWKRKLDMKDSTVPDKEKETQENKNSKKTDKKTDTEK